MRDWEPSTSVTHVLIKKCGLGSELPRSLDTLIRFRVSLISTACCTTTTSLETNKQLSPSRMSIFPQSNLITFSPLLITLENHSSIRAYNVTINFLKDYATEFHMSDIEFSHLFSTENVLAKITYELHEAQILAEIPIEEPGLGYVYLEKKTNGK